MSIRCRLGIHTLSNGFTQPDPPFEKRWNTWLKEAVWYEVFDHECVRCGAIFRHWRWTHEAMKKEYTLERYKP